MQCTVYLAYPSNCYFTDQEKRKVLASTLYHKNRRNCLNFFSEYWYTVLPGGLISFKINAFLDHVDHFMNGELANLCLPMFGSCRTFYELTINMWFMLYQ